MGFFKDVVPLIVMVAAECSHIGSTMLFKAASLKGMSYLVFLVCTYVFSSSDALPMSFRIPYLPNNNSSISQGSYTVSRANRVKIHRLGVISGNKGLELTSPTLSASIGSLTPVFTFMLAVIFRLHTLIFVDRIVFYSVCEDSLFEFKAAHVYYVGFSTLSTYKRMEILTLKRSSTQAKMIGTIVSMSVASALLTIGLNNGWPSSYRTAYSVHILQTDIMRMYPEKLAATFFYRLCVAIVTAPIPFIADRNSTAWTHTCTGHSAICSATTNIVHSFLGEPLHTGR
ncbi:hypothetical protein ACFE04_011209 [Oxalis oulophora]